VTGQTLESSLAIFLLAALTVPVFPQNAAKTGQHSGPQSDTSQALEFLGSYSAPSAIEATETGHTSARPPAPPADRRLRSIEGGLNILPPWPADLSWTPESLEAACGQTSLLPRSTPQASGIPASSRAADLASFRQEIVAADAVLGHERFAEAVAAYDRIVNRQTRCPAGAWNRALAEAYARLPTALADLAAAQPDAPSAATGYLLLGLERLGGGDLEGARSDLQNAFQEKQAGVLTRNPKHPGSEPPKRDILWGRAVLAWASTETVESRHWLSRLLTLEPQSAEVWFLLGGVALEEARATSRRLTELAPDNMWNRRLEGEAVEGRYPMLARRILPEGSKLDAKNSAAESATLKPAPGAAPTTEAGMHPEPETRIAASAATQPEGELQQLETLPDSPQVLYLRARAALHLSELAYDRASTSPRLSAQFHALRALAAEQENDEARAKREYEAGLDQNPGSAVLHAGLGHLYRQRQELDRALPELSQAYRLDPGDPVVAFELGDVYQRLGQQARAIPLLNQALQTDPGLLVARWSRAKAYLALGDDQGALAELEAAAPSDRSGELQSQLARLYRKLGRSDLAAQAQQRSEDQRHAAEAVKQKALNRQ
jgi:tetratricopeptide (TPR) repeat protein